MEKRRLIEKKGSLENVQKIFRLKTMRFEKKTFPSLNLTCYGIFFPKGILLSRVKKGFSIRLWR
jgi:hypothetical protein